MIAYLSVSKVPCRQVYVHPEMAGVAWEMGVVTLLFFCLYLDMRTSMYFLHVY